ncbi:discoidin domain-containing protein [Sanguibacter gelidistatuariae]|uniref:discoidin domain-containing protein n=1 Tax=Sanguibacter gelidistatuariae TaxID=1814289 RepID=UPI000B823BDB|nr:discoidin domain-containing protein [Sanguibacter gelidistatuariae]
MSRRRWWFVWGVVALLIVLVVTLVGIAVTRPRGTPVEDALPTVNPHTVVDFSGAAPVCGFPDVSQITSDGSPGDQDDAPTTVVANVATVQDGRVLDVVVTGDGGQTKAWVLEWDSRHTYTVTRYDVTTGTVEKTFPIDLALSSGGEAFSVDQIVVDDNSAVYLLDTLDGRRDVVKYTGDGDLVWRMAIPTSATTTDSVLSLYGMVLFPAGVHGDTETIGIHEGSTTMHVVTQDGHVATDVKGFTGTVVGQSSAGDVFTVESADGTGKTPASEYLTLSSPAGKSATRFGSQWVADTPVGMAQTYRLAPVSGAAPGPTGTGVVVAENGRGLEWFNDTGVRIGYWPDRTTGEERPYELADGSPIVENDETYYLLVKGAQGSDSAQTVTLAKLTTDELAARLASPVKYNEGSAAQLAVLGAGAGLVTDRVYNAFAPDETPAVSLRLDSPWAAHVDGMTLRYQVRGDPTVWNPVTTDWTDVPLTDAAPGTAPGTTDLPLTLPPTRPGVYQVDAQLLDPTGTAISGTCLQYAVGQTTAGLAALPDGADWGGAAPLRGVTLAEDFNLGSYRYQVDFGSLVTDPTAQPSEAGLNWDAIPLDDLAAAAALAQTSGVKLVLQLGQGGDAEKAAVTAGTWQGWTQQIIADLATRAPGIIYWSPWNEPNNTGYDDGAAYVRDVAAPFAAGARLANPAVKILGGNTLGVPIDWWKAAVDAGACTTMDAVAVHPYTGLNRSWEEDGWTAPGNQMEQLFTTVEPCGTLPVWDTESGWWSDGVANSWAQGADVSRKLLWYSSLGVTDWTYFFSEGGFGETGNSWSLLQFDSHVKPGLLTFETTQAVLAGRGAGTRVDLGVPSAYGMHWEGPGTELLAVWTDDLATSGVLRAARTDPVTVTATDQYGAVTEVTIPAGRGLPIALTGAPVFLTAPAGTGLSVGPAETYGPDVLLGATATASSTNSDTKVETVTSGTPDVDMPWRSGTLAGGAMDKAPWVEVTLEEPTEINRISVATAGIRCCSAGLRDYTVSAKVDGLWTDVATVKGQFFERITQVTFDPVTASAIRVSVPMTTERGVPVLSSNYSGVVGGMHPSFMQLGSTSDYVAAISAISAWAPGTAEP